TAVLRADERREDRVGGAAREMFVLARDERLAAPRLFLRVWRLRGLHALHVAIPELVVAVRRRDAQDHARAVWMQRLRALEVAQRAVARAASDVLGPRVEPEHADHPSALLARVGVLVVARTPAHLLEDRAVERVDEARERHLGLLADRVS